MKSSHGRNREKDRRLGATGRYPRGTLNEHDEGELQYAIVTYRGTVIINYGKPVAWFGLAPADARRLAQILEAKAEEAERHGGTQTHPVS